MSAYDKVAQAKQLADEALEAFQSADEHYRAAVDNAAKAIAQNNFPKAELILAEIGYGRDEPDESHRKLWTAVLQPKDETVARDATAIDAWNWAKERLPMDPICEISGFFARTLLKGSPEIVGDVVKFYPAAGDNWHSNWDDDLLLGAPRLYEKDEANLVERLKTLNVLLDYECPPNRLSGSVHRLAQYAASLPGLSPETLTKMDETLVRVLASHFNAGHTAILEPGNFHLVPPESLSAARTLYLEAQKEHLGSQKKPKLSF